MPVITQPLAYFTALQSVSVIPSFRRNCIAIANSDQIALGRHNIQRVSGSCVGRSIVDIARAATLQDMQFCSCVLCISPSYRGLVGLWLRRAWRLRSGNSSSQHNIPPVPAASSLAAVQNAAGCPVDSPIRPYSTTRIDKSRSCPASTAAGAPNSKSDPLCVFGKAMTSRSESAPASIATKRSMPGAMPPCGGAP